MVSSPLKHVAHADPPRDRQDTDAEPTPVPRASSSQSVPRPAASSPSIAAPPPAAAAAVASASVSGHASAPAAGADPASVAAELETLNIIDGETGAQLVTPSALGSISAIPTDNALVNDPTTVSPTDAATDDDGPAAPASRPASRPSSVASANSRPAPSFLKRPLLTLQSKCKERKATAAAADPPTPTGTAPSNYFLIRGPQPACQLFSLFKALAAGADGGTDGALQVEVDTDSEHEDDSKTEPAATKRNRMGSAYSSLARARASHRRRTSGSTIDTETAGSEITASETLASATGNSSPQPRRQDVLASADRDVALGEQSDLDASTTADSDMVKRWLKDTVSKQNEVAGERFAAISVSSASPFAQNAGAETRLPGPLRRKSTARGAGAAAKDAGADAEASDNDDSDEWHAARSSWSGTSPTNEMVESPTETEDLVGGELTDLDRDDLRARFTREHIPAKDKLAVIIEEFGDIASKMVDNDGVSEPERLLAESQGSLFKGVMMVGNLHLTSHRLVFHALLPPNSMYQSALSGSALPIQTEDEATARSARPDIIVAGPVTIHRHSLLKTQRRVWMELSPDMLTTYPSADEAGRVRPLFSILLSSAFRLGPFDPDHPFDFHLFYWTNGSERSLHFTTDNETSAIRWRRHFEGVLFGHARERFRETHLRDSVTQGVLSGLSEETASEEASSQWSLLRCAVPLDLATLHGISEFHQFATLVNLEVDLEPHSQVSWLPDEVANGNYAAYTGVASESSTPTRSRSLRQALPHLRLKARSRDASPRRDASPQRSPLSHTATANTLQSALSASSKEGSGTNTPKYYDTTLPPFMHNAIQKRTRTRASADISDDTTRNTFDFLIAVMNDQAWFAQSLESAVEDSRRRHYKPGATPAKMVLDVGGYDCLAMDDELDSVSMGDTSSDAGERADDDDDEGSGKPRLVIETRKAEKAAMAARVFGLRQEEGIWLKRCYVQYGLLPARGHIIVNPRFICFWRRARLGADIKYRFSTRDVKGAVVVPPITPGLNGMSLKLHGHHDLRFEMFNEKGRDEVIRRINAVCAINLDAASPSGPQQRQDAGPNGPQRRDTVASGFSQDSNTTTTSADSGTSSSTAEAFWEDQRKTVPAEPKFAVNPSLSATGGTEALKQAANVLAPPPDLLLYPEVLPEEAMNYMPFVANRPWAMHGGYNVRLTARRFTMLTIGSRGDVQPYIALALRLMRDGHKVVIVTHDEFKTWIEGYGIEHRQAGGDPTALMKLSTEHRMFSPGFFKEALGGFRGWLDDLLADSWKACQDADVLIESPSAMAGVHIAESLKIPYFRAFTMPWTRTATYPQAFMVPAFDMGPSFNYSSYVLFDNIMWRATSGQINRWRKKSLGLGATDQSSLSISKVPFLYNFSPAVVPKPLDWYDDITITGYWNLENSDMDWQAPDSLLAFMDKAKADGKPIVYIGFGSIVVPHPAAMTKSVVKGVEKAGVCAIIAKGWSARDAKASDEAPFEYPESCYPLDKVPHGWLFPKIQAAMHHGGAGTVGASLRAGIPTLIKPWFGDQHFWALRVTKLGVGMKIASLRSEEIADALRKATTSTVMIEKAARIGERIRSESGVDAAVQAINFNIVRAARDRSRLKKEEGKNRTQTGSMPFSHPHKRTTIMPVGFADTMPCPGSTANKLENNTTSATI